MPPGSGRASSTWRCGSSTGRTSPRSSGPAAPCRPTEVVALLAPIADALDVAHARGIVHRDVTPSNIRLDARGIPYLTDFGLTKRAATSGPTALTLGPMGTPAYMAPEQFAHEAARRRRIPRWRRGPTSTPSGACSSRS